MLELYQANGVFINVEDIKDGHRIIMFNQVELLNEIVEKYDVVPYVAIHIDDKYLENNPYPLPKPYYKINYQFLRQEQNEYRVKLRQRRVDSFKKHIRELTPKVIIDIHNGSLCIPKLAKFAGVNYRPTIYLDSNSMQIADKHSLIFKPGSKYRVPRILAEYGALAHNLMLDAVVVYDSKTLADINTERKNRICLPRYFVVTNEIAGMHIYSLRIEGNQDWSELFTMLGSIKKLACDQIPQIPVDFNVEELVLLKYARDESDHQHIADNPNIRTLIMESPINANFANNTTLIRYEGLDHRIRKIANQNAQAFANQRFARTKVIISQDQLNYFF